MHPLQGVDLVLTATEVATLLRCDRKTVYEACRQGLLPHKRIGKLLRFSRNSLEDWLQSPDGGARALPTDKSNAGLPARKGRR